MEIDPSWTFNQCFTSIDECEKPCIAQTSRFTGEGIDISIEYEVDVTIHLLYRKEIHLTLPVKVLVSNMSTNEEASQSRESLRSEDNESTISTDSEDPRPSITLLEKSPTKSSDHHNTRSMYIHMFSHPTAVSATLATAPPPSYESVVREEPPAYVHLIPQQQSPCT